MASGRKGSPETLHKHTLQSGGKRKKQEIGRNRTNTNNKECKKRRAMNEKEKKKVNPYVNPPPPPTKYQAKATHPKETALNYNND